MNENKLAFQPSLRCLFVMLFAISTASSQQPKLLWQDTVDFSNFDQAFDVDAINNRVFVVGFVGNFQNRDFLVRAYNADDGNLLWQDRVNNGVNDYAAGVVAEGTTVFVSGATGTGCCPDCLFALMMPATDGCSGRIASTDPAGQMHRAPEPLQFRTGCSL